MIVARRRAPYAHEGSPVGRWGPFTWGWPSGPDGKKTFNLVRFSVFSVMQPRLVPVKQSAAMLHEWIDCSPLSMGGCKTVLENPTELTSLISAAGKTFRKWVARYLLPFIRTYGVCTMQRGHVSWLRGFRRRLVPKAALPCALFSPFSPMPFGQMSDPLLRAVCSSVLLLFVRLQSAALWFS